MLENLFWSRGMEGVGGVRVAFTVLLHQAAVGGLFALVAAEEGWKSKGFLKVIAVISLALQGIVLGVLFAFVGGVSLWQAVFFLFVLFFVASLYLPDGRRHRLFYRMASMVGAVSLLASALLFRGGPFPSLNDALLFVNFFLSALFLGSVTTGMLLGHWYLIEPGLSIKPLKRLTALYVLSALAQGLFVLASLAFQASFGGGPSEVSTFLSQYGYTVAGRVGIGILLSVILGALVWKTLKIPHTQAATGLLYVAVVSALVGEFLGRYLLAVSLVPL